MTDEPDYFRVWREQNAQTLEALLRLEAWASNGVPAQAQDIAVETYEEVAALVGEGLWCLAALSGRSRSDVAESLFKHLSGEDTDRRRAEMANRFRRQFQDLEDGDDA
jgi:hypothetical protein